MYRFSTFLLSLIFATVISQAQVRPEHLYNVNTPFGVLDIRTAITATKYYYLDEGKTFSFRESAPGIRTNTFLDMTSWDSSPYKEGNLKRKDGAKDEFIMNYRLLPPVNYNATYEKGYPLIVLMHGSVERANCYYQNCYHADWNYDPNANVPPAPTTYDHKLLNNDHHLIMGGTQHLQARDLAGSKLPNDPSLPSRAFPGFVLMAQMLNVWDSLAVEDVIRIVRLHCEKYNIDENRIYIHGLSIGGYATYEAIKRAPWLFAAALPMSAVSEAANIFKHNQQNKVAHIPLWTFQGGIDKNPTPAFTESVINKFKAAGALVRYTVYPNNGHRVWDKAYGEPDFFSWILAKNKSNVHVHSGQTVIDASKNQYPKLMLAEGFFAYQWEKDGVVISSATSNTLTVNLPGIYRARFSRVSGAPGLNDWNDWSQPVTITAIGNSTDGSEGDGTGGESDGEDDGSGEDGGTDGEGDPGGDDGSEGDGEDDGSGGDDGSGEDDGPDGEDDGDGDSGEDDGGTDDGDTDGGDGSGEDDGDDGSGGDGSGGDGEDSGDDDGSGEDDGTDGEDDPGGDGDSGEDDGGTDDGDSDGGDGSGEDDGSDGDDGEEDDGEDGSGENDGSDGDDDGSDGDGSGEDDGSDGDDNGSDDGSDDQGGDGNDDGSEGDSGEDEGSEGDDDSGEDNGDDDNDGQDGSDDSGDSDDDNGTDSDNGDGETITGVEADEAFTISVYPNPTPANNINIEVKSINGDRIRIQLINMLGDVLYTKDFSGSSISESGNISFSLPIKDGVYILVVSGATLEKRQRLMIRNDQ
jgi:hypothetical protein